MKHPFRHLLFCALTAVIPSTTLGQISEISYEHRTDVMTGVGPFNRDSEIERFTTANAQHSDSISNSYGDDEQGDPRNGSASVSVSTTSNVTTTKISFTGNGSASTDNTPDVLGSAGSYTTLFFSTTETLYYSCSAVTNAEDDGSDDDPPSSPAAGIQQVSMIIKPVFLTRVDGLPKDKKLIYALAVYYGDGRIEGHLEHLELAPDPELPIAYDGFQINMSMPSEVGFDYQLYTSTNLSDNSWIKFGPPLPGTGYPHSYSDTVSHGRGFYKMVISPDD